MAGTGKSRAQRAPRRDPGPEVPPPGAWGTKASTDAGRSLRKTVPRTAQAEWAPSPTRPDPVDVLEAQDAGRVPELVTLRHRRMLASPFAFLRGAAALMAQDLATTPVTGLQAQLSGDAHLANFGVFGTPERNLVFDVNDFDETLVGPWEWDLKRLATSFVVAARTYGHRPHEADAAAQACARSYREHMRLMSGWTHLQVWYARVDAETVAPILASSRRRADAAIRKARQETNERALPKLTASVDGVRRIVDRPPLIIHLPAPLAGGDTPETLEGMQELHRRYRRSLDPERRVLLDRYRLVDAARKVVGVGSVGTRCSVALLLGASEDDPLFLQVKEAGPSVLEAVLGPAPFENHGERVVRGQRVCQAAGDSFLGWVRGADGRDYYVRQLRDMRLSVNTQQLSSTQLVAYAARCGQVLARAHARSGDRVAIGAYLGPGPGADLAITRFAIAYADQTERDFTVMVEAAKSGRITVPT